MYTYAEVHTMSQEHPQVLFQARLTIIKDLERGKSLREVAGKYHASCSVPTHPAPFPHRGTQNTPALIRRRRTARPWTASSPWGTSRRSRIFLDVPVVFVLRAS